MILFVLLLVVCIPISAPRICYEKFPLLACMRRFSFENVFELIGMCFCS